MKLLGPRTRRPTDILPNSKTPVVSRFRISVRSMRSHVMFGVEQESEMYQAQFYRVRRGQSEDIGSPLTLQSTSAGLAQDEALALVPPEGANCVKIVADGLVISRHGFAL